MCEWGGLLFLSVCVLREIPLFITMASGHFVVATNFTQEVSKGVHRVFSTSPFWSIKTLIFSGARVEAFEFLLLRMSFLWRKSSPPPPYSLRAICFVFRQSHKFKYPLGHARNPPTLPLYYFVKTKSANGCESNKQQQLWQRYKILGSCTCNFSGAQWWSQYLELIGDRLVRSLHYKESG